MDEKLRRLKDLGRKVKCSSCYYEWYPDQLKDKRCPNCQTNLEKAIERELER